MCDSLRPSDYGAASYDQAIDEQQYQGTDNRADPSRTAFISSEQSLSQEPTHKRTCYTEKNRHDPAAGIFPRHHEFGDRADDQTEE